MPEYRRILIMKPSSLGDVVYALPTLSALRERFPNAHIAWLVKKECAEILEGNADLDEIIAIDFRLYNLPRTIMRLRRSRFELVVDLQGLLRSALLSWLSGAPERVGFAQGREGSPFFYTQRVKFHLQGKAPWRLLGLHVVDRNLIVAEHLGADISQPRFRLPSFWEDREAIELWLKEAGVKSNEHLIALAPRDRTGVRSWPLDSFLQTAVALSQLPETRILLIGLPTEGSLAEKFQRVVGDKLLNLVGRTRVRHLGLLLRRIHLLIGNDSAPLHIASAAGTPVLGLYGPTSAVASCPYGQGHRVLTSSIPCSPCGKRICHNAVQLECLSSISVDQVVEAAKCMLNGTMGPGESWFSRGEGPCELRR